MCHSRVYFTLSGNQTSLVPIFFSKELIRESFIVRQYSIKEETLGACHFRQAFTNPNFGSNIPLSTFSPKCQKCSIINSCSSILGVILSSPKTLKKPSPIEKPMFPKDFMIGDTSLIFNLTILKYAAAASIVTISCSIFFLLFVLTKVRL